MPRRVTVYLYFMDGREGYYVGWNNNAEVVTTKDWHNAWSTENDEEARHLRERFTQKYFISTAICEPKNFK